MKKANKIWIVILLILMAGTWSTSYTKKYVGSARMTAGYEIAEASPETVQGQKAAGQIVDEETPEATLAAKGAEKTVLEDSVSLGSSSDGMTAAKKELPVAAADEIMDADVQAVAADSDSENSPQAVDPPMMETEPENRYRNRLEELDAQIAKNHAASGDTTANSLKAAAENERKLWEAELNRILDALEQQFSAEQEDELFKEQKEWIRERENTAVAVSKKQSGSAMEEVEYNISLAETTRTRAYELAEQYASVLAEAD